MRQRGSAGLALWRAEERGDAAHARALARLLRALGLRARLGGLPPRVLLRVHLRRARVGLRTSHVEKKCTPSPLWQHAQLTHSLGGVHQARLQGRHADEADHLCMSWLSHASRSLLCSGPSSLCKRQQYIAGALPSEMTRKSFQPEVAKPVGLRTLSRFSERSPAPCNDGAPFSGCNALPSCPAQRETNKWALDSGCASAASVHLTSVHHVDPADP